MTDGSARERSMISQQTKKILISKQNILLREKAKLINTLKLLLALIIYKLWKPLLSEGKPFSSFVLTGCQQTFPSSG